MGDRESSVARLKLRQEHHRRVANPPKHSAANSHVENDQYMEDWDKAYEMMRRLNMHPDAQPTDDPPGPSHGAGSSTAYTGTTHDSGAGRYSHYASASTGAGPRSSGGAGPTGRATAGRPGMGGAQDSHASGRGVPFGGMRGAGVGQRAAGDGGRGMGGHTNDITERWPSVITSGWQSGPVDPEGVMCDISDRPSLCSAAHWGRGEVVVGSSDHALYMIDAQKGTRKRTLYSKTCGHCEWVTCCIFTPSGQVVSGGQDAKLWVWPAGGVRGVQVDAHTAPVSKVAYDPASGCVTSCSYDKSVKLWDVAGGHASCRASLQGHGAPVLEMAVSPDGLLASGDRSGCIILWDGGAGQEVWRMRNVHQGHITSLTWFDYEDASCAGCFVSGGQDGCVRVWDPRGRSCVAKLELHVNDAGRGAVGDLAAGGRAAGELLVSAGADGTLCVCDPRASFALLHQIKMSNFPYSMAVAGGLALVGLGDGSLWVVHIGRGETLYCLGANRHAVRCIEACSDRLIASGDDGKVLLWHFS